MVVAVQAGAAQVVQEPEEAVANFGADVSRLGKEASGILGNCFLLARLSCEEAVEESR